MVVATRTYLRIKCVVRKLLCLERLRRLKKRWLVAAFASTLVFGVAVGAAAGTEIRKQVEVVYRGIQVTLDGKPATLESEPFVLVSDGRTYVPASSVAELLGARASLDETTGILNFSTSKNWKVRREEGFATYTSDYYGFGIRYPSDGVGMPLPGYLHYYGSKNGYSFSVSQHEIPADSDFERASELFVNGYTKDFPRQWLTRQSIAVPGADEGLEVSGTVNINGEQAHFRLRLLRTGTRFWTVAAVYAPENASLAKEVLDSFVLLP